MASEVPKGRKKRITVKPKKPPNPLFEKWLEEWKNEAASKDSIMQYCFGKALSSLRKYPLPLKSGRDCGVLDYFGNRLCIMLDHKLAEYRKTHPEGKDDLCGDVATHSTSSPIASTSSQNKPKKKKNLNIGVFYNNIMLLGGKISFMSASLWKIHHFPHYVCAAIIWTVLAVALF